MKREIVLFGAQILHQACPAVEEIDDEIRTLVGDLFDSMRHASGVGLTAPQIGVLKRVCVVDVSTQEPEYLPVALINPKLVSCEGAQICEECCLGAHIWP